MLKCTVLSLTDACALIDWMLTVEVDERATVEDIANHWWVNWGFEEPVCDCQCSQECPSPLLARYIDWQNREPREPCAVRPPPDLQYYFTLPLRPAAARQHGPACLKKSRKENAISPPAYSAGTTHVPAGSADKKKPKGILKTQSSFDTAFLPHRPVGEGLCQAADSSHTRPACCQTSSKNPKKGILKKLYEGESGYSSSPERSDAVEGVAGGDGVSDCTARPYRGESSPRAEVVVRRRKGILKRNGKFSASVDLTDTQAAVLQFPESLQELLLTTGGTVTSTQPLDEAQQHQQQGVLASSRPASVISDDSFLSCDSFDLLDMATHSHRKLFSRGGQRSGYSSEEELQDQGMGKGRGKSRQEEEKEDSLEERQELFRQAKEISEQL